MVSLGYNLHNIAVLTSSCRWCHSREVVSKTHFGLELFPGRPRSLAEEGGEICWKTTIYIPSWPVRISRLILSFLANARTVWVGTRQLLIWTMENVLESTGVGSKMPFYQNVLSSTIAHYKWGKRTSCWTGSWKRLTRFPHTSGGICPVHCLHVMLGPKLP